MKADMRRLSDKTMFLAALNEFSGGVSVVIHTHRQGDSLRDISAEAAAKRFAAETARLPFDLTFRAFDAEREAAWYGTEGVLVTLSEAGSLDIGESLDLKENAQNAIVWVREIVRAGRVIYLKLEPVNGEGTNAVHR